MTDTDVLIVGAGPAGAAAAVMAASLRLRTTVVEREQIGGRLRQIDALENVPGGWATGQQLAEALEADLERLQANGRCELLSSTVTAVHSSSERAGLSLEDGQALTAATIVVATGVSAASPADAPWLQAAADLAPPMLWRTHPSDLGETPYVLGADRPLGTWLRAHPSSRTALHVLCPPSDDYKTAEIVKDPRVRLLKIAKAKITRPSSGVGWMVEVQDRAGERASYSATSVLNNIGSRPTALPGLERGEDGYCSPDAQPPRLYTAGDLRSARCQRVITSQGSGAEAVLTAYYRGWAEG